MSDRKDPNAFFSLASIILLEAGPYNSRKFRGVKSGAARYGRPRNLREATKTVSYRNLDTTKTSQQEKEP